MTYQIQQCSPKANARIDRSICRYCNGCGMSNPQASADKCDGCNGSGMDTVNVGIQAAPETGYPFVAMLVGQCFVIPFEGKNEKTLRNRVAVQNKKDERKFIVVKHTEFGCYEVARVK